MSYIGNLNTYRGLIGKIGEDAACEYLESIGHKIVERNYRIRVGEIDIISQKDNIIHFVEVKTTKSSKTTPEEHIDAIKMKKMKKLAELYFTNYTCKMKIAKMDEKKVGVSLDFIGIVLNSDNTVNNINYLEMLEV